MMSVAKPAAAGCFALITTKKQILRFSQDDIIRRLFSSLLG